MVKNFLFDEEGMGTVELVLIIAALVSIAIIFRKAILGFVQGNIGKIMDTAESNVTIETETKKQ